MFADELLKKSLSQYEEWGLKESLPSPFFRKSESYFDYKDFLKSLPELSVIGRRKYTGFIQGLFDAKSENGGSFLNRYEFLSREFFAGLGEFLQGHVLKREKFGSSPIAFSSFNINFANRDVSFLLARNPGSPILNKVCSQVGVADEETAFEKRQDVVTALHQEIDPIWDWLDGFVHKKGYPMTTDVFLAGLIYRNKGDISGSLWDAAVLTKLVRHDPNVFYFIDYIHEDKDAYLGYIGEYTDIFLNRFQDNFAPRLSANWVNQNVRDKDLFAYDYKTNFRDRNYKPFDRYSAAGDIYHGLNLMALNTATSPELLQAMVIYADCYSVTKKIEFNPDLGLEKITSDLLVGYRAEEVRKILDNYKIK